MRRTLPIYMMERIGSSALASEIEAMNTHSKHQDGRNVDNKQYAVRIENSARSLNRRGHTHNTKCLNSKKIKSLGIKNQRAEQLTDHHERKHRISLPFLRSTFSFLLDTIGQKETFRKGIWLPMTLQAL